MGGGSQKLCWHFAGAFEAGDGTGEAPSRAMDADE
jgi:hypothetical protein